MQSHSEDSKLQTISNNSIIPSFCTLLSSTPKPGIDEKKQELSDSWIIYHQESLEFYKSLKAVYESSGELSAYVYEKVHGKD